MWDRLSTALHLESLFSIWAVLDIVLLAVVIYQLLVLIRGTRAVQILIGVALLVFLHQMTRPGLVPLPAIHNILGSLLFYLPFVIIVLFQNQIRHALARVGRNPIAALIPRRRHEHLLEEIALAAVSLASKRLGALIVIERELGLRAFYETGIALDALPSYDLLMNIFTKQSPLHDGAAILAEGRIKAASCYLPLTTDPTLSRTYGTRHRAALGITSESDALAIIVSEERNIVSLAEGGRIYEDLDARSLTRRLERALAPKNGNSRQPKPAANLALTGQSDA